MQLEERFVPQIHFEHLPFSSVKRTRSSAMVPSTTAFALVSEKVVDVVAVLVVSASTAIGGDSGGDGVVIMNETTKQGFLWEQFRPRGFAARQDYV